MPPFYHMHGLGLFHRPLIMHQQITYRQSIPYAGYYNDMKSFMLAAQQLQFDQMQQMQQYNAMNQYAYMAQMQQAQQMDMMQNQYAYLNQNQSQLATAPKELENLNTIISTMANGKDYTILPAPNNPNKYTVISKDGYLIASGDYAEVRDKLLEINKNTEVEEEDDVDEVDDEDDIDEADDDEDDDDDGAVRTQKVPSQWYNISADKNDNVKALNANKIEEISNKLGSSAARAITAQIVGLKGMAGCLNMKQLNDLTKEIIYYNQECLNEDGSLKGDFSADMLAIPNADWIRKYIIGGELGQMRNSEIINATKKHATQVGNSQYDANYMAWVNYRETDCKDVYYNNQKKTHAYYFSHDKKYVTLPEVKFVDKNGNWIDKSGKKHTKAELIELAEHQLEGRVHTDPEQNDSGKVDTTTVFEDPDE